MGLHRKMTSEVHSKMTSPFTKTAKTSKALVSTYDLYLIFTVMKNALM